MLKKQLLAIFVILLLLWPLPAQGQESSRLVVLIINSTSLEEIHNANMPTIKALIKQNKLAVGLMNSRGAKSSFTETSGYLTMGAGSKANAGSLGSLGFNENEHFVYKNKNYLAREWYKQTTGYNLKKGQTVSLGVAESSRLATKYNYSLVPGLLGKELSRGGIKRAVVGNADTVDGYHREAALIAMDTTGKTDFGDLRAKSYKKVLNRTKYFLTKARFVVVELGDTARVAYRKRFFTDNQHALLKAKALKKADVFLKEILKELDLKRDMLVIVSPVPSKLSIGQRNLLTPIFIVKENQNSFLFSKGTKWTGIVNNTDFAPTVLKFFSLKQPVQMSGSPLTTKGQSAKPLKRLFRDQQNAVINNMARLPLLTGYVVSIIFTMILGVLLLLFSRVKIGALRLIEGLLLFILSVPPVLLLFGFVSYSSIWALIAGSLILSVALTLVLFFGVKNTYSSIAILIVSTASLIIADVATGSTLMRSSVLGFSPIIGARFYGLGNEYMGVVIGTVILSLSLIKGAMKKNDNFMFVAAPLFALVIFFIGFPGLGANVGGALAASVAFISALFYFSGASFSWKQPVAVIAGLLAVAALIVVSGKIFGLQTHVSKTSDLIASGGTTQAILIFKRKILANLKLVRYTAWTNVLITFLILLPILFVRPSGALKRIKEKQPHIWAGVVGIGIGSIATFIFNDSGVVAAATSLLYAAAIVLYVIINEQKQALIRQ